MSAPRKADMKKGVKKVSQLKKMADKYFSQYVRLRDSENGYGECISCGEKKHWKNAQAGHFVSRSVNALRYDEENVNLQCVGCNMFKQGNQYAYAKALDLKYGDGKADELWGRRHESKKFTTTELEEIIQDCKTQIKCYEENSFGTD